MDFFKEDQMRFWYQRAELVRVCIGMMLISCAQSGSRLDEMEAKVAVMNQRLASMSESKEQHIGHRQELLRQIQAELKPREDDNEPVTESLSPIENSPIPDMDSTEILSVPIGSQTGSESTKIEALSKVDAFLQAMEKMEQKLYSEAAYLFYEIYLNKAALASVREESLYNAGECFYLSQDWNQTVDTHLRFFQEYPQSVNMPKVLLQIGKSYQATNQTEKANYVFHYLSQHFPNSGEARQMIQN